MESFYSSKYGYRCIGDGGYDSFDNVGFRFSWYCDGVWYDLGGDCVDRIFVSDFGSFVPSYVRGICWNYLVADGWCSYGSGCYYYFSGNDWRSYDVDRDVLESGVDGRIAYLDSLYV